MSPTALPRPPSWIWGPLRSREERGTGREEKEKNTGMEERGSGRRERGGGEGEGRQGGWRSGLGGLTPLRVSVRLPL